MPHTQKSDGGYSAEDFADLLGIEPQNGSEVAEAAA